ncbi:hypothetical protein OS493_007436 [Desmophyllum pertusum]|uniref:Uncharacterized protein n=1 Tax=Desmophyllum pertusum TaxID=174260 RepID=A0A9W9Z3F4_9CNID|nr:hypothetical protein OS493_007436 [Desmophyllum pertusum]
MCPSKKSTSSFWRAIPDGNHVLTLHSALSLEMASILGPSGGITQLPKSQSMIAAAYALHPRIQLPAWAPLETFLERWTNNSCCSLLLCKFGYKFPLHIPSCIFQRRTLECKVLSCISTCCIYLAVQICVHLRGALQSNSQFPPGQTWSNEP